MLAPERVIRTAVDNHTSDRIFGRSRQDITEGTGRSASHIKDCNRTASRIFGRSLGRNCMEGVGTGLCSRLSSEDRNSCPSCEGRSSFTVAASCDTRFTDCIIRRQVVAHEAILVVRGQCIDSIRFAHGDR